MFTLPFILSLIFQASLNHTITSTLTMEATRSKPNISQLETLGDANQLSYKTFGQLQIIYILELSITLVPKSFCPTSISWYSSMYNQLLLDLCFIWNNTFVDCILETKDCIRWCCILRLKFIHNLCINFKHILFEMRIFYTSKMKGMLPIIKNIISIVLSRELL